MFHAPGGVGECAYRLVDRCRDRELFVCGGHSPLGVSGTSGEGIVCGGWSVQVGATPPLCWWNQPSLALDACRRVIVEMPVPEFQSGRTSEPATKTERQLRGVGLQVDGGVALCWERSSERKDK
jgi:hypothetical protein